MIIRFVFTIVFATVSLLGDNMIGSVLAKLGRGETLSAMEIGQLEKFGNEAEFSRAFSGGIQSGQSDISANEVRANRGIFELIDIIKNGVRTGQIDGDLFMGEDLTDPAKATFHVFSTAQTYNSESMGAGDMLLGDNSTGKPNLLWNADIPELQVRSGTTVTGRLTGDSFLSGNAARANLVQADTSQTISTATTTYIDFVNEKFDDDDYVDLGTSATDFIIPRDGRYLVIYTVTWEANATGIRWTAIYKNDGANKPSASQDAASTGDTLQGGVDVNFYEKDDVLTLGVWQNSGGDLDVDVASLMVKRER